MHFTTGSKYQSLALVSALREEFASLSPSDGTFVAMESSVTVSAAFLRALEVRKLDTRELLAFGRGVARGLQLALGGQLRPS